MIELENILDFQELCERLSVSRPTLLAWIRSHGLPTIMIGKTRRFHWPDVLVWFRDHTTHSARKIQRGKKAGKK